MEIIIQKFGGTSLATPESRRQAALVVSGAVAQGLQVVVVVSAMGRKGDPYATDTLLGMLATEAVPSREADLLMSCGEIIAATLFVSSLEKKGIQAVALTGAQAGIITNDNYGCAHILRVVPDRIKAILAEGNVAVVTGFQGKTEDGEITTLGRGGSDTSAVAIGAALRASRVEIFTDVSGLMTADPRLVQDAKVIKQVTYHEVAELAHLGAKVIHPRAVEIAMAAGIEIWVKGLESDSEGTLITGGPNNGVEISGDQLVTGIAHISGVAQVRVELRPNIPAGRQHIAIFSGLAQQRISVDLINVFPDFVVFTVAERDLETADQILRQLKYTPESRGGFAKVSAVGAGMRGVPGVMAKIVQALSNAGVEIYQSADSHANISCLVRIDQLERAISALHTEFGLAEIEF